MTDYNEDPLESLLDEQTDMEFSIPEIRDKFDHGASEEKHGNLKTWSAKDFSSIYVRFYPHLVRHAKRYLSSDVQAEEVVQDAFLYMMTALPEIDSELGVLKFMKWKVRLLALDVIRATPNRRETLVDSFDDEQATEETDSEIERADDMAVIGAALAKLNPRHREALIATVYEEKTSTEVAAQMQLSENATRQLVFRARAAFKKALIGEAEVAGKSVSEILSIATKRAASGARESARTLSLLVAIGLGSTLAFSVFEPIQSQEIVAKVEPVEVIKQSQESTSGSSLEARSEQSQPPNMESGEEAVSSPDVNDESQTETRERVQSSQKIQPSESSGRNSVGVSDVLISPEESSSDNEASTQAQEQIASVLSMTSGATAIFEQSFEPNFQTKASGIPMELRSASGLQAFFFFEPGNQEISSVLFRVEVDGKPYFGIPSQIGNGYSENSGRVSLTHTSASVTFVDQFGNVTDLSELRNAVISIQVNLDELGRPTGADLTAKA